MSNPPNKLSQIAALNTGNPAPKAGHNNETGAVKGLILSIVQSLEMQAEEREAQKEMLAKLKADHGIEPKIARKVAKLIYKKNKEELDQDAADVDALYSRLNPKA